MGKRNNETWVWVVVENPEKNEKIVGQMDETSGVSFFPVFESKENALMCMNLLAREPGKKYEPQALMYGDLVKYARENQYIICFLDDTGKIIEKIAV